MTDGKPTNSYVQLSQPIMNQDKMKGRPKKAQFCYPRLIIYAKFIPLLVKISKHNICSQRDLCMLQIGHYINVGGLPFFFKVVNRLVS